MQSKESIGFALSILLALTLATSCASAPSQVSPSPAETKEFSLGSEYGERQVIVFQVPTTGKIRARAEWKGKSSGLALVLNGPGQVGCYQRVDGPSVLVLSQTVTPEILAKGTDWTISIICWDKDTSVNGILTIEYPK